MVQIKFYAELSIEELADKLSAEEQIALMTELMYRVKDIPLIAEAFYDKHGEDEHVELIEELTRYIDINSVDKVRKSMEALITADLS